LEQPLTDFFPEFADYGHSIRLEHLLRHTSGVKDYEKLIPDGQERQITDTDVLEMLASETEGDFEAGSRFRYSNSGYALLAMVVTAISGLDFPVYLKEQLFREAGMVDALALVDGPGMPQPPRRAIGYEPDDEGGYRWADQNVTTAVLGDGGIYCSVGDYARWIEAYFAGQVMSEGLVTRAWTPGVTTGGDVVPYGYGWRLEAMGGNWRPYHPGSTSGFRNGVVLIVGERCAALALTNRCNGDAVAVARAALAVGNGEI
jgi:CubicO group peptidase (beta-lactamase class C family)